METLEKPETSEKPLERKPEKFSPNEIQSIQGIGKVNSPDSISTTDHHTEAIKKHETLNDASIKASGQVSEHQDSVEAREVEYLKLRGRIGEELAQGNIPDSVNINDVTGKSNFANYDIVSPHEVSSVKVKELTKEGQPRYSDYNKYFRDITDPNSKANQRAAQDMLALHQEDPDQWLSLTKHIPGDLSAAQNTQEMAQAMSAHATLRIPGDQVAAVRNDLKWRAWNDPTSYGLNPADPELETKIQEFSRTRIKSINKEITLDDMCLAAIDIQRTRPHVKVPANQ